jgi:hypothetical protein
VQAATFYRKKAAAAAFVDATPARKESAMTRHALDQSNRYADISWDEEQPIKNGKHVLVAYIGYDYLATAAHFAAESPPERIRTFAPPMTSRSLSTPLSTTFIQRTRSEDA